MFDDVDDSDDVGSGDRSFFLAVFDFFPICSCNNRQIKSNKSLKEKNNKDKSEILFARRNITWRNKVFARR